MRGVVSSRRSSALRTPHTCGDEPIWTGAGAVATIRLVRLSELLRDLLPFPPAEASELELESPGQLHDIDLAQLVLEAVREGADRQGVKGSGAWWFAVLAVEALTGWAVGDTPPEVEEAFASAYDPTGTTIGRAYVFDSWEALLADASFAYGLELAWQVARDVGNGCFLPLPRAAEAAAVPEEELRQRPERGEVAGARKVGRVWLVPVKNLA